MAKYISPFTDWGFKRLFGQEFSKDLLISFLNDLFEGEYHITNVTFKDKEQIAETKDQRACIFDIYCTTDDGKHFIVEMQNRWAPFFINRSIYYASKAIVGQRKRADGEKVPALYQLLPVYVVCIMNFTPRENEVTKFRTDVALREKRSEEPFSDKLRFIYLSLPYFKKEREEDCHTDFEKWIYILKHMEALERIPFTAQKTIFKRLADLADIRCLSQEEQEKYDESRKMIDDYYSGLYGSFIDGHEIGMTKGVAKGRAEGIAENKMEIAAKMLKANMDIKLIASITGLSKEKIATLKSNA